MRENDVTDESMKLRLLQVLREEIERVEAELTICKNLDCQHPFCPEHSLEN